MKKIVLFTFLLLLLFPNKMFAQTILRGFGGKVISSVAPPVVCSGGLGPVTIVPAGTFPALPYGVTPQTKRVSFSITPGGYILGLYVPTLSPICFIPSVPVPVPVSAFPIFMYGTSSP